MTRHEFNAVSVKDIGRLVMHYVTWIESMVSSDDGERSVDPDLLIPPWEFLRDHYTDEAMDAWPTHYQEKVNRIAERAAHLTLQDVSLPDFIYTACLNFLVADCNCIMDGEEFRQATAERQLQLRQFKAKAVDVLAVSKEQMVKALVRGKYNREAHKGSKDWHVAEEDIDARLNRAFTAWCQTTART